MSFLEDLNNINYNLYTNYSNIYGYYTKNRLLDWEKFFRDIYSLVELDIMNNTSKGSKKTLDILAGHLQNIQSQTNLPKRYDYLALTQKLCYLIRLYNKLASQIIFVVEYEDKILIYRLFILFIDCLKNMNNIISLIIDIETISSIREEFVKKELLSSRIKLLEENIDILYNSIKDISIPLIEIITASIKSYEI